MGWVEAREVWVRLNLGSLCVLGKPELNKNWLLHRWRFVQSHNTGTLVIFTLSLMCCVYERSPTSLILVSGTYLSRMIKMSCFLLSSFVPNGFSLSIVSFLSIEKQMMLRMERATHHKSLINWAMEVFGKGNLRVQMCIIRYFFGASGIF